MKPHKNCLHKIGVFHKLILLFVLLLVPLMIISFYAIYCGNQAIKEKSVQSFVESTNNIADSYDNQLEQIYNLSANIFMKTEVEHLSAFPYQLSLYERINSINIVIEYLTTVKLNNFLINNVQIYLPSLKRILNAINYKHGSMQVLSQEDYEALFMRKSDKKKLYYENGELYYLISSGNNSYHNFIRVDFSPRALKDYLSMFALQADEFIFITDSDGNIIKHIIPEKLSRVFSTTTANTLTYNGTHYKIFKKKMEFSGFTLVRIIPEDTLYYSVTKTTEFAGLILTLMFICIIIYFIFTSHLIKKPLSKLIYAFTEVENENLHIRIPEDRSTDFSTLYAGFNHMISHLENLIENDYEQKLLLQKAELKQLQAQINPHFLYNSFFMLQRLIRGNMLVESSSLAQKLGNYFQYITRSNEEVVLLKNEYEHAKIYMDIQAIRFDKRIKILCEDLPPEFASLRIPKIILQPIVENAFNYGLQNKEENGILSLRFIHTAENTFCIEIEDNGDDLTDTDLESIISSLKQASISSNNLEMTGILNIHKRLLIYSSGKASMKASRSQLGGLKIIIELVEDLCTDY
jgi:Histidine kinase-, DNA gyrase B-, and HSP90-like ATPase./Histidine kinase./HAMP domain.